MGYRARGSERLSQFLNKSICYETYSFCFYIFVIAKIIYTHVKVKTAEKKPPVHN